MSEVINGSALEQQPAPAQRDESRKYCDTCKFFNMILSGNAPATICRRRPPTVIGNFIGLNQAGQLTFQQFSTTLWTAVGKDDWCGDHVDDPRAVKGGPKASSVIAGSDRVS